MRSIDINDQEQYEVLPDKELRRLLVEYQTKGSEEAFLKIFHHNLNLVRFMVKETVSYYPTTMIEKEDLIQEGSIALMNAISMCDPTYKNKVSTYLSHTIRNHLANVLRDNKTISVGNHNISNYKEYQQFINAYYMENGQMPTRREIAEALNVSEKVIEKFENAKDNTPISMEKNIRNKTSENETNVLKEMISDKKDSIEQLEKKRDEFILLKSLFPILDIREYYVIYHNVISENPKKQTEIAKELEVTNKMIGIIRTRALAKIKKEDLQKIQRRTVKDCGINIEDASDLIPLEPKLRLALHHLKQVLPTMQYTILYTKVCDIENDNLQYYQKKLQTPNIERAEIEAQVLMEQVLTEENIEKIHSLCRNNLTITEILRLNILPEERTKEESEKSTIRTIPILENYLQILKEEKRKEAKQQEQEIISQIKDGNNSLKQEFLMSNIPLINSIINKCDIPETSIYEDLIQEGLIVMMKGLEKYDPEQEAKFTTYIYKALYGQIKHKSRSLIGCLKIPDSILKEVRKYRKIYNTIEQNENIAEHVSFEKVIKEMGLSKEQADNLKLAIEYTDIEANKFTPKKEICETSPFFRIEKRVEDEVLEKQMVKETHKMLEDAPINEREKEIICLLNGVGVDRCYSSYEVADMYHLTGTRVRQIRDRAYEKLRNDKEVQKLASYIGVSENGPVKTKCL